MGAPHPEPDDILALARLEEHRLATAVGALADVTEPFAGGVLARGVPGTWLNACFGAGAGVDIDIDIDRSMLEHLIDFYAPHGIEPRIELNPFVKPSTLAALAELRFVVRSYDSILYRRLDDRAGPNHPNGLGPSADAALPADVTIERVDTTDDAELDRFARASLAGFAVGASDVAEVSIRSMCDAMRLPGTTAIVAMSDGAVIGAAAMETVGEIACLFGAAVAEPMRGRGIQRAMIQWRLRAAAESGARYATIGGAPGGPTERNVRRVGFTLAYMRTAFVRPDDGLRAVVE